MSIKKILLSVLLSLVCSISYGEENIKSIGKFKDWDFSKNGIIRQVKRMRELANKSKKKFVLADFICPIEEQFKIFKPHYVVWMDTIKKSRYKKINKIFNTKAILAKIPDDP